MNEFEIEIRQRMDEAAKEDRERFFKVADTLTFQPKYKDKIEAIEELKQQWRDMTSLEDYPNIDFPITLPEWFPTVHFASCWKKDIYISGRILEKEEYKKNQVEIKGE